MKILMTRIKSLTIIAVIAIAVTIVGMTQIQTNAIPVKMIGHTETISLGIVAAGPNGSVSYNIEAGKTYLFYGDTLCKMDVFVRQGIVTQGNAIALQFTNTTLVKHDTNCAGGGYSLILTTGQDEIFERGDMIVLTGDTTSRKLLEVYREQTP